MPPKHGAGDATGGRGHHHKGFGCWGGAQAAWSCGTGQGEALREASRGGSRMWGALGPAGHERWVPEAAGSPQPHPAAARHGGKIPVPKHPLCQNSSGMVGLEGRRGARGHRWHSPHCWGDTGLGGHSHGDAAMGTQPWGHRWGHSHGDAVVWMRPFSWPRHRLLLQHRPHPHPPPCDDRSPITNPLPAPYRFDTALHAPSAPPGGPRTPPLWPTPPTPMASPARAQRSSHPIPLPPTPHPIGVPLPSPARGEAVGLCRAGGWVPRGGGGGFGDVWLSTDGRQRRWHLGRLEPSAAVQRSQGNGLNLAASLGASFVPPPR